MTTTHKGTSIYYSEIGQGPSVVLLHGFLENSTMWDAFLPTLSQQYCIICIDLLGHGKTSNLGYIHSMEDMAAAVKHVVTELELTDITLIGHSMGGYVCCAFAKAYPEITQGICLLNATPEADTPERKKIRMRANKMAKENYEQLVRMSFVNLFDKTARTENKQEIAIGLEAALQTSVQGYIAANTGMMQRTDYAQFWKESTFTKGMILGQDDWIIDSERCVKQFTEHQDFLEILPGGHMSHIGQASQTLKQIRAFLEC